MKSFWLKAGFALLGLVVILALFVLIEHERGRRALAKGIAELRAKGEKLTVAELTPPRPPEDQNGARLFLDAANRLGAASFQSYDVPGSWSIVVPGKARLATERKEWDKQNPSGLRKNGGQPQPMTMEEVRRAIEAMQPDLEQVRTALRKPALDFEFQYSLSLPMVHLSKSKSASSWLRVASLTALHQGDAASSLASLEAMASLAGKQTEERTVISQLVGIAEGHIGFGATWEALQSPGWTDQHLARLQAAWTGRSFLEQMAKAMEMERAMGRDLFERFSDSDLRAFLDAATWMGNPPPVVPALPNSLDEVGDFLRSIAQATVRGLARWIYMPLWRMAWADQDHLRLLQRWQICIEATRLAAVRHSWQECQRRLPEEPAEDVAMNAYDQCRFLVSRQIVGTERRMVMKAAQAEALRSLAVAAIAVKRHQLRHGKPPPSLSALVPEYLPAIPFDEMDGQPLRYRLKPDGHVLLYSVGTDGVDDGGDASLPKRDGILNVISGRDLVWPEPATEEEIAEAEAKIKPRSSSR